MRKPDFVLRTERLALRPLRVTDSNNLFFITKGNTELTTFLSWNSHRTLKNALDYCTRCEDGFLKSIISWGIYLNDEMIGVISLHNIEHQLGKWKTERAELGFWLVKEHRKRGIMTEAGTCVLDFAFKKLKLHKIIASHREDNQPSEKVINKLGFELVGKQKQHYYYNRQWYDRLLYEKVSKH